MPRYEVIGLRVYDVRGFVEAATPQEALSKLKWDEDVEWRDPVPLSDVFNGDIIDIVTSDEDDCGLDELPF